MYIQRFMQSCNSFPNCGQLLPRMQIGFPHKCSMTRARILGNNCPQFVKLLHYCMESLYNQVGAVVSSSWYKYIEGPPRV